MRPNLRQSWLVGVQKVVSEVLWDAGIAQRESFWRSWGVLGTLLGLLGALLGSLGGILGASWEALGSIQEGFVSCFGPNLQLGKHLRSDLLNY